MRKYPFIVGIDIDWEYPAGSTDGDRMPENENDEGCPIWDSPKSDNTNFALLLKEMRERFDTEFGVGEKMITACASSSTGWTLPMQQWENFEPYLDYINIMTYDLTGTWAGVTAHHTPLDLTESAVEYFITKGIVPAKLNIGSPMYPMWFKMSGDTIPETIVGAPIDANAVMPAKFLDTTAMQMLEKDVEGGWIMGFDEAAGASYLYNAKINSHYYMWFVTYENLRSLLLKIDMINRMDLAGIIVWESSQDTEDHLMINYMNDGLNKE